MGVRFGTSVGNINEGAKGAALQGTRQGDCREVVMVSRAGPDSQHGDVAHQTRQKWLAMGRRRAQAGEAGGGQRLWAPMKKEIVSAILILVCPRHITHRACENKRDKAKSSTGFFMQHGLVHRH
ncbi:uncharacterized protein MAM_00830 [Metarhizium album ARSEF 1941]|uniref:Uncharacterized protein n=1 Tax=Metarhizium album (strain ARSEF 1941) TaxID=1081103 RepID=A0A0B2X634_METAS|nr:uncharacterized protein MAM_00830 [Metarhizium album ARSEF 1941]KHO01829.1 hypothetical protein MAM_00830 [Metarhizium album ARSEF 1941]